MPSYKIVYFDGRGRAELSRLILAASGTPFEDVRVKDWPNVN
jgi:glutathione S-transferase